MRNKYFVSIIWGYSTHMYGFSPEENYHLHALKIAEDNNFNTVVIIGDKKNKIINDPNFNHKAKIVEYRNFVFFLFNIIKFSFKKSVFYVNSLEWQSFIIPFIAKRTIFMAHTQPKRKTKLKQNIQRFVFRFFKFIRLNNETEKKFLIDDGVSPDKLKVVPLVVSSETFKIIDFVDRQNDLVCFGNVTKIKDLSTIIKAFEKVKEKFPNIKLNIIGNVWDAMITKLANNSVFSSSIIFHGFISSKNSVTELNKNLIYLNSSFNEGQCVAVYDAALCGCVLCLPKIMSFIDVFKDCALFHDVGDYKTLAKNIEIYLSNNDVLLNNKEKAIKMIKNNYSIDFVEKNFSNLINSI